MAEDWLASSSFPVLWQDRAVRQELHERVERLFVEFREEIYCYVLSQGVRAAEAQEIAQEAFLKYLVALGEGQVIENPRAWLYTVAHNLTSTLRARGEIWEEPAINWSTPESLALERERAAALLRAIGALSPQQRSCLRLRAEGFRYSEIAGILGLKPSTVGEFLQRAVKRLRKVIYE